MSKLNQIIAVANGKKTQAEKALTETYQKLAKNELFNGISRTYRPLEDGGETQPSENKYPQFTASEAIDSAQKALIELIDIVATQDTANTEAKADVIVDGNVVLNQVPVTHLLFLEKQLTDIGTFVSKLPTLDAGDKWEFSTQQNYFVSEPTVSNRSVKKYNNHVKAEATDKHPAQVEVYTTDVKVGEWTTKKFSGAIEATRKNALATKVKKLSEAIKMAREEANSMTVQQVNYGDKLMKFIFS